MYYKHSLKEFDVPATPTILAGIVYSIDHARGGSIREANTGALYKFSDADVLSFGIYPDSKVLFCAGKNGTATKIRKIEKQI
jgi:hypothetical protein